MEAKRAKVAGRLKLAGRIIGFGVVGFVLTFLIGETCMEIQAEGWQTIGVAPALIGVITGVALAGCILSWWKLRLGGILLIISAVLCATNIPPLPPLIPQDVRVWLIIGLPRLVAGIFFLSAWRVSREVIT
ncbi:MAG: hypothetical protein JW790_03665 [Dehalococcoidales bacterium]|nr:hypothetical protein [Dehalococcoidales bacterium]